MMTIEIVQSASEGDTFAPQTFDQSIGKTVPMTLERGGSREATLVAAVVADDGKSARLTFDFTGAEDVLVSGASFVIGGWPLHD